MSPQRFSHWAGMPSELLVNSPSSFGLSGILNVPWMVAQTNSFGVLQREIMISRISGAFVPLKVSTSNTEVFASVIFALRRSVLTGLVFDPISNSRAALTLPFKLSTQHCPCFPSQRPSFLLTQLLNRDRKEKIQSKPRFYRIFLNQKTHHVSMDSLP